MSRFKPATARPTHLKAAFVGFQGGGKTFTAVKLAIGLIQKKRKLGVPGSEKPVFMVDTERGYLWIRPLFEAAGIELQVDESRAFADLKADMQDAIENSSLLLIDSITAHWLEFCEAYKVKKKRSRGLEFQDWGFLKEEWRKGFTQPFLNSALDIIFCGRAGFTYDHYTDDAGKKQIEKSGVKLKAEGELGFEPNLLVYMEREQDTETSVVKHVAHIMKDRRSDSKSLDGKSFANPTFQTFAPHIDYLDLGGATSGVDASRTSADIIPVDIRRENNATLREVVIEEIKNLLSDTYEGRSDAAQKAKRDAIEKHLAPTWKEVESLMSLDELRIGFNNLHLDITGKPSRYFDTPEMDDAIPEFGGATSGLQVLLGKYAEAADIASLNEAHTNAQAYLNDLSEGDREKASTAYAEAVRRVIKAVSAADETKDQPETVAAQTIIRIAEDAA
jgi:hypothetical protein